jgi:hypothetical protein
MTSRGMVAIGLASEIPRRATIEMMDFILEDCGIRLCLKHDCDFSNAVRQLRRVGASAVYYTLITPSRWLYMHDLHGTYLE